MSFTGIYKFKSIASFNENGELITYSPEEYLSSPMPYIDENDAEEVAHERKERERTIGTVIKVCEDGKLYMLMPLPAGVSEEEVKEAVDSGALTLVDGMMTEGPKNWEERNGELWYDSGVVGEVLGEKTGPWTKISDENGNLNIVTMKFEKVAD